LKSNGSVVTWGDSSAGGNSSSVASQLTSGVTQIFSTEGAFAALKSDGSVVTWGGADSSSVASQLTSGVTQIFSTDRAFAALKSDGSVVTWGSPSGGGDSSSVASQLTSGVSQIFSTEYAFAALKSNGSVVTWGDSSAGGNSSSVASQLTSGVTQIFSTWSAFAALKSNGSVVTWGSSSAGGNSSSVASQLSNGVTRIFSTEFAFAALKSDGSVVTWGGSSRGGDSSSVASQLGSGVVSFADPFNDDRLVPLTETSVPIADVKQNPSVFMDKIRDYDGNNLGGSSSWKLIGDADVQGDGDLESIFVNPLIRRWATVGVVNSYVDFSNHGRGGDTRVVGIYIDPTLKDKPENIGGPFDSQQRFQNDLRNDNLKLLAAADYNKDGFQDLYFKLGDGTAVLRALMHADGNIQYANYQSKADLTAFMTANNVSSSIWGSWL
jgi:alpha-tubulin suppressor-like RCC1 family protein